MSVFDSITKLLDNNKVVYKTYDHEAVFTSDEAAKVRGTTREQGAKALVMFADKKPIMVVLSGTRKVSTGEFKKQYRAHDLRMATPEEVEKLTNTKVGAVPPFGNLFSLPLYVDRSLGENEEIAFNAGEHTKSIKMKYADFEKITNPIIGTFSAPS